MRRPSDLTSEEMNKLTRKTLLAMKETDREEEEALKLAQKELYPDFFVGASPGIMGRAGNGVDGIWEVSLGLKVPLYFWSKRSRHRAGGAELKGAGGVQPEIRGQLQCQGELPQREDS
jgi:outer membrane protein TolC